MTDTHSDIPLSDTTCQNIIGLITAKMVFLANIKQICSVISSLLTIILQIQQVLMYDTGLCSLT